MPTMNDVAKLAKVSVATVSFAFNKPDQVKEEKRQRVLNAAKSLGYQPNMLAQGLKGSMSKLVAILVADIRLPIAATIAKGVEDVFLQNGYLPVISSTRGDTKTTIQRLKTLQQQGVGGFILLPSYFGIDAQLTQTIKEMSMAGVPMVFVGEGGDQGFSDNITYDSRSSAQQAVDYLISLGHKKIAYIGYYRATSETVDTRLIGYRESHNQHQLTVTPDYVEEIEITPQAAYQAMHRLRELPDPPTAVLAINDVVALGVLDYCAENNLSIPDDLSLVTYDYQTLTRSVTSNITSIVISGAEAGSTLANLLIQRQKAPKKPAESVLIQSTFEVRTSTASPSI